MATNTIACVFNAIFRFGVLQEIDPCYMDKLKQVNTQKKIKCYYHTLLMMVH